MGLTFKTVFLLATIVLVSAESKSAESLISVGTNLYIDRSTLHREGTEIRYLLIERWVARYAPGYARYVDVDCSKRTRKENVSGPAPDTSEPRTVFEGTRQAAELDTACRIASELGVLPAAEPKLIPEPKVAESITRAVPDEDLPKSSGSGFVISPGTGITNYHVVEGCTKLATLGADGLFASKIIALDEANDLAAISLPKTRSAFLPISSVPIELGAGITVLGFPLAGVLGTDLRATTGIVSSLSGVQGDKKRMQISASVQPGNSGGPVLDEFAGVTGVVVSKLAKRYTADNVNFAIRTPVLKSFLELNGIGFSLAKRGAALNVAEIVKRAKSSTVLVLCY